MKILPLGNEFVVYGLRTLLLRNFVVNYIHTHTHKNKTKLLAEILFQNVFRTMISFDFVMDFLLICPATHA